MLTDLIQFLTNLVSEIVSAFGAPGIAFVALCENLFPPTPSEALYPLAGKLAFDGQVSLWGVVVAGVIGSVIGSLLYYRLGYWMGESRVRGFIQRRGRLRLFGYSLEILSEEGLDRGLALFDRYGYGIVVVARLMPVVHAVVSIPAGVVRMNLALFVLYTAIGSALWIAPLALFGYWLGDNWQQILAWLDLYQNAVYALLALLVVYVLVRHVRARRFKPEQLP